MNADQIRALKPGPELDRAVFAALDRITPSGRGVHLRSRALRVRIGLLSQIDPVVVAAHLDRLPDTTDRRPTP